MSGMKEIASSMKLGGGRNPASQMGPLVSKEQHERVLGYIEKGVREGGEVLAGGGRQGDKGYFVQPTIFKNCGSASTLYKEESLARFLSPTVTAMRTRSRRRP